MKKKILALFALTIILERNQSLKLPNELKGRYKRALVLGSGGVVGVGWHLATLKRLVENKEVNLENIDLRIGTSAGSIAALAIGSGISLDEALQDLLDRHNPEHPAEKLFDLTPPPKLFNISLGNIFNALFSLKSPRVGVFLSKLLTDGVSSLGNLESHIDAMLNNDWPEKETWAIAANMKTGRREILSRYSNVTPGYAIKASAAVPALFKPVTFGKAKLVDGGILSATHVDLAFKARAKEIFLLTMSTGYVNPFKAKSLLGFINLLNQNIEEFYIQRHILWAIFTNQKFVIYRPRPKERAIIDRNRLMDDSSLSELISVTVEKP